ncbi:hypothetical protein [Collimonas sp.]|uniref:hypothetical protein n=1 Tax=Collimonas sp. TaxID=1963772 RepID=UPI002BBCE183|nr:hypothetical protein [Collimonas sp.]HWW06173.1 hypothetical protein [Collimonas sp.]
MDELDRIIARARSRYQAQPPSGQDMRETLRALSRTPDEAMPRSVANLDQGIKAAVTTAALKHFRQSNPAAIFVGLGDVTPADIRVAAKAARRALPRMDGRRNKAQRDEDFALELGQYWLKSGGNRLTVTKKSDNAKNSAFLIWALDMFHSAGREISSDNLAPILRRVKEKIDQNPHGVTLAAG